jgi:hypothetical protein
VRRASGFPRLPVDVAMAEIAQVRVEVPGLGVRICPRIRCTRLEITPDLLPARPVLWQRRRSRYRDPSMASESDKVTVALDPRIVADVRRVVHPSVESDVAAVERALNAYLLGRLVDTTQARSDLAAVDAERIAYDEVHAQRRQGRDDAPHDPTGPAPPVSASELVCAMRERNAPRRAEVLRRVASLRRIAERLR